MFFDFDNFNFVDHTLTYGNYGGFNYSNGMVGGTITESPLPPVDPLDTLFFQHDFVYQTSTDPAVLREADVDLVEGVVNLAYKSVLDWLV
jgi:hypothetical protein